MRIGRIVLGVFAAAIVVFALLVVFALGGTKVISNGSYGPFTIGEEKSQSAAILESLGVWPPSPAPFHRTLLEAPDAPELRSVFSEDEGVIVWFGQPFGSAMRLEFTGDILDRTWPTFQAKTWSNPNPGYDEIDEAMLDFQNSIVLGMSREDVFELIANNKSGLKAYVSAHAAGADRFFMVPYEQLKDDPAYSVFVYKKPGWTFTGLDDLLWYSGLVSPFHSRVSLFFENNKLKRIEHSHGPIELP